MKPEYFLSIADTVVAAAEYDLAEVPWAVRVVYLISQLEFEVAVGGVAQWVTNRSGRCAAETVDALEEIGAFTCANLVRAMLASFGPAPDWTDEAWRADRVARSTPEQWSLWSRLGDALLQWPDDVNALLVAFVERHGSQFIARDGA
jgi:Domain of unknown function (DUF4375)